MSGQTRSARTPRTSAGASADAGAEDESALSRIVASITRETFNATDDELREMGEVIKEVKRSREEAALLVPTYEPTSELPATDKWRGLPRMEALAAPPPPAPYMMDLNLEPAYAIRAFKPLWLELKTERDALHSVINGLCVLISKWNGSAGEETHVALNQGKMHVPWGRPLKMLHAGIAIALQSGRECWITEIKTPWYRYFADFDFVQPDKLSPRQIEALVFVVQRAVRRFFPGKRADDPLFYAIVCSTGYKPVFASKEEEKRFHLGTTAAKKLEHDGEHMFDADRETLRKHVADMPQPVAWKTGVHVTYVNLFVNNAMALYMRETIIFELANTFGVRVEPMNDWTDVVDVTVYKGSGLRMVGNRKSDPCPQCKGARRVGPPDECVHCHGTKHSCTVHLHWVKLKKEEVKAKHGVVCPTCAGNGRVDTGRPYMPMFVVDSQGYRRHELEDVYRRDFVRLINDTSIRWRGVPWADSERAREDRARARAAVAGEDEEDAARVLAQMEAAHALTYVYEQPRGQGWEVYEGAPPPVSLKLVMGADGKEHYEEEDNEFAKPKKKKAGRGNGTAADATNEDATTRALSGSGAEPRGMSHVLARADPLAAMLQDFIRARAGRMYADLLVTRVATNKERTAYFVNVQGPNCHFCHNVGTEHSSNRIYFMFTSDGMWQRCHKRGPKTEDMKFGACEEYRSAPVDLPSELKVSLFPKCAAKMYDTGAMGLITSHEMLPCDEGDSNAWGGADAGASTHVDIMRDPKVLSLLNTGDRLSMMLFGAPWSSTLESADGKHFVRVNSVDTTFVARSAQLMHAVTGGSGGGSGGGSASFVGVDFSGLGQRALDVLMQLGFDGARRADTHHAEGSDAQAEGSSSNELTEVGTAADEVRHMPSIQRLHAVLVRQVAAVVDAAVALPCDVVASCLASERDGFSQLVAEFRAQRAARPVIETLDVRIARTALKAADALLDGKGKDVAVWMTAIEEARTMTEKEKFNTAYTQWQQYLTDHPAASPRDAAEHVRNRGVVVRDTIALAKRKREAAATAAPPAAAPPIPAGPRFKKLREFSE